MICEDRIVGELKYARLVIDLNVYYSTLGLKYVMLVIGLFWCYGALSSW